MADETVIATEDLYIGWACAHRKGDTLPAEAARRHGWEDKVAKPNTKAAQKASEDGA